MTKKTWNGYDAELYRERPSRKHEKVTPPPIPFERQETPARNKDLRKDLDTK